MLIDMKKSSRFLFIYLNLQIVFFMNTFALIFDFKQVVS